ncbi:MAG: class D beta-lactamase [Spirochaetae bacterium HGW-Spirochaetae-1]|jgi:beta-lactamase class D|nr:MAG: class D beta-lactamase [Spirochaetae bacterium HGW-Spirochaetae-1]
MKHLIITAISILLSAAIPANSNKGPFLRDYMRDNNITGTVVIESLQTNKKFVYDEKRAAVRFTPASTFKIVNTLIALQEKAVNDENEIIKWDGRVSEFADWNRDQSIKSAFGVSCVWFYQELARRVGNGAYMSYLKRMNYGNQKTGEHIDTFWLDGSLQISALEQISVLKNIYNEKYGFDKKNYEILKEVMIVDRTGDYIVRAKTGTAMRVKPVTGWYVGYIETKGDVWFFACNIDMERPEQSKLRKETVYRALREAGLL